MIKSIEGILVGSDNAKKLADFYKNKVGLELTMEAEVGEKNEGLYIFEMKGCSLYIMDHSQVKGKNKMPGRFIFNLQVDNIEKEFTRLVKAGVKKVAEIYHVEDYGHVATFEDVEGNYFQIVKTKA